MSGLRIITAKNMITMLTWIVTVDMNCHNMSDCSACTRCRKLLIILVNFGPLK